MTLIDTCTIFETAASRQLPTHSEECGTGKPMRTVYCSRAEGRRSSGIGGANSIATPVLPSVVCWKSTVASTQLN